MSLKRAAAGLGLVTVLLVALGSPALAQEAGEDVVALGQQVNLLWIVIGAVLVIFMQAGFALVETGFCRAKHAAHVMSTNFAIFGLGFVAFFLVGYAFMFGGYSYVLPGADFGYSEPVGSALFKVGDWVFLWKGGFALTDIGTAGGAAVAGFFLYMVAFMDTVATIPTGSMAERWKWKSFVKWGFFCGAIYYPLFGAWTWGGGWLSQLGNNVDLGLGYADFAGSGVVHAMGGMAALSRRHRPRPPYRQVRQGRHAPGHPRPQHPHGHARHVHPAVRMVRVQCRLHAGRHPTSSSRSWRRTPLSPAPSVRWSSMYWITRKTGKPDPGHDGQRHARRPGGHHCAVRLRRSVGGGGHRHHRRGPGHRGHLLRRAQAQDRRPGGRHLCPRRQRPVRRAVRRASSPTGKYGAGWNLTEGVDGGVTGILYGGTGAEQLMCQVIGAVTIIVVGFGLSYTFFKLQDRWTKGGIRSSREDEIAGLDLPEMGVAAYTMVDSTPMDGPEVSVTRRQPAALGDTRN